jgi:hypothetical protein
MDFRLHESLANFFTEQKLDGDGADVIRVGGAIKSLAQPKEARDREFFLEQLNVAYELHGVRQFYLINHEALIQDRFPDTEILTYFMRLSGTAEVVD